MNEKPTTRAADRYPPIRERWIARPERPEQPEQPDDDGEEARAGALLRQARCPHPLGNDQLAAIERRLSRRLFAAPAGRPLVLQVAIGVALLLTGGGLTAAALGIAGIARYHSADPRTTARSSGSAPGRSRERPRAMLVPRPEAPLDDPPLPVPTTTPARAVGVVPRPRQAPPPPPETARDLPAAAGPAQLSQLAQESELLSRALSKLRRQGDATGALALLDEYQARFAGARLLEREVTVTRVEALVRVGRHREALAVLDPLALAPSGLGRELLAARGELRADAGRCVDAIQDFDAVLEAPASRTDDAPAERALHGRASCRSQRGDPAGARADLESYLARFPTGRFAAEACAALRQSDSRACPR